MAGDTGAEGSYALVRGPEVRACTSDAPWLGFFSCTDYGVAQILMAGACGQDLRSLASSNFSAKRVHVLWTLFVVTALKY